MYSSRMTSALFTFFFALTAFFSFSFAAAVPANFARDVWNPKVLTPNGEVWVIGTQAYVTWDTSDAPAQIAGESRVELVKGGVYLSSGPGSAGEPLAKGFDLRAGYVEVTVPDIEPGSDYQVALFGDSGNLGPLFTISH